MPRIPTYLKEPERPIHVHTAQRRKELANPNMICMDCGYTWKYNQGLICTKCESHNSIEE